MWNPRLQKKSPGTFIGFYRDLPVDEKPYMENDFKQLRSVIDHKLNPTAGSCRYVKPMGDCMEKTNRRNLLLLAAGGVSAAVGLATKSSTEARTPQGESHGHDKPVSGPLAQATVSFGNSRLIQP